MWENEPQFIVTGVGKAILAYQREEEINRILDTVPLESYTEFTITDKDEIKKQLESTKSNGAIRSMMKRLKSVSNV